MRVYKLAGTLVLTVGLLLSAFAGPAFGQSYGTPGGLQTDRSTYPQGGQVTLDGQGYRPNSNVDVTVQSDPVSVGSATTNSSGSFRKIFRLPSSIGPGQHTITASGVAPDGSSRVLRIGITVTASGLPRTGGSDYEQPVGIGLMLVLFGTLLVFAVRRVTHARHRLRS